MARSSTSEGIRCGNLRPAKLRATTSVALRAPFVAALNFALQRCVNDVMALKCVNDVVALEN